MLWVEDPQLNKKVNEKLMKATNPLYLDHPSLFTAQTGRAAVQKRYFYEAEELRKKKANEIIQHQIEINSNKIPASETIDSTMRI